MATESDTSITVLERQLRDQLIDLGLKGYLDEISVQLNGSVRGDGDPDTDTEPTYSGTAELSASLEIIPQLVLEGSITATETSAEAIGPEPDPVTASLGLTLAPLADPTTRRRKVLAAETSRVELAAARNTVAYQTAVSLVDAVLAEAKLELLRSQLELADRALLDAETLHERDRTTDRELQSARASVWNAREMVVRAEFACDRTREVLARTLNMHADQLELPSLEMLQLDSYLPRASELLETVVPQELAVRYSSVANAEFDIERARLDLRSVHLFHPQIAVTATGGAPDWTYDVGLSVTLSPSQWDSHVAADARTDLERAMSEYEYATRLAEIDAASALSEVRLAMSNVSYAEEDLKLAEQDLAEAGVRLERGAIGDLDRDRVAHDAAMAEYDLYSEKADLLRQVLAVEYAITTASQ
jgi:outer membrane protein TolC